MKPTPPPPVAGPDRDAEPTPTLRLHVERPASILVHFPRPGLYRLRWWEDADPAHPPDAWHLDGHGWVAVEEALTVDPPSSTAD